MSNGWTRATKENPCPVCGHDHGCLVAPDGTAASCFDDGNAGKVVQLAKPLNKLVTNPAIVARYPYRDESGELLYESLRWEPGRDGKRKSFTYQRPAQSGKFPEYKLGNVRRVLYKLPELLNAREDRPGEWRFVVEGEKDADNATNAGLIATCNVMGAGKWQIAYADYLAGERVCIIADKDANNVGQNHARDIAASLAGKATSIKIIELPGGHVKDASDFISAGGTAQQIIELADTAPEWKPDEADTFGPMPLADVWRDNPELKKVVIDGLGRVGQVMNLISTSKAYKTYLILSLAISMVKGVHWLNTFGTCGGRVLLIDMELQPPDIARRTKEIARAMFADPDAVGSMIDVLSLRGRNASIEELEPMLLAIPASKYALVIIDPLYKTYPESFDENSNAQMTALYRRFERIAESAEAALMIVHHASKGSQSDKRVTDVGSGAGAQARAPDAHIALREHEEDGCVVFDAKVRSFPPNDPIVLRWDYPLWHRESALDPAQLKTGRTARNKPVAEPVPEEPKPEPWTAERFATSFITDVARGKATIMAAAEAGGLPVRKAMQLFDAAREAGLAHEWKFVGDKRKSSYANVAQPVLATVEEQQ